MFSFFRKKCVICKKKAAQPRKYYDDQRKPIVVCSACVPYAERRAFQKRGS